MSCVDRILERLCPGARKKAVRYKLSECEQGVGLDMGTLTLAQLQTNVLQEYKVSITEKPVQRVREFPAPSLQLFCKSKTSNTKV